MTASTDQLPSHQPTRLILTPDDLAKHTAIRTTDVITAMCRGLAEYVSQLGPISSGGRTLQFTKFFEAWAEPNDTVEDVADGDGYPRFVAWTDQDVPYDAASFTRTVTAKDQVAPGLYLVGGSEAVAEIYCEVWSTDPTERQALVGQLEDAFSPVEWMAGFRLELPHYYSQRATFLPKKVRYFDDDLKATQGFRVARLTVVGNLPQCTIRAFPLAQPRTIVDAATTPPEASPKAKHPIGQSVVR